MKDSKQENEGLDRAEGGGFHAGTSAAGVVLFVLLAAWCGVVTACCGLGDLKARHIDGDCNTLPPRGYIRVLYRKYADSGPEEGCGFFRASRLEARALLNTFDNFESHAPEVIYRSTGIYPLYTLRVIQGGCPPGHRLNCMD